MRNYIFSRNATVLFFALFMGTWNAFSLEPYEEKNTPITKPIKNNRPHHIIFNAPFDYAIVRDKLISPLLHHSLQGGLVLGYEYRSLGHEHRILLQLMAGTLTRPNIDVLPGGGTYKHFIPRIAAQYLFEYSFAIPVLRMKQWYFALGGIFATALEARNYIFSPLPMLSFSTIWDFGPSILASWHIVPKHNLRFRLAMPIMSIIKRPAWNFATPSMEREAHKSVLLPLYSNPRVTSVHEWFHLTFEVKHEWEITKLVQFNTEYRSALLLSSLPRFFGIFSNRVSFGISFRL